MDLYLLNELNKLESGASSGAAVGAFLPATADGTIAQGEECWAMVTRVNDRQQQDNNNWSSSSPYTTFYAYLNGSNDAEFAFSSALDMPSMYSGATSPNPYYNGSSKRIIFANGSWIGTDNIRHSPNGSNYSHMTTGLMFVKNPTATDITVTLYANCSSQSGSYDGCGVMVGTPNNTDKSLVTGLTWTNLWTYTSSTTSASNSFTLTVPANKTVVVLVNASSYYWTGTTYNHYYTNRCALYGLTALKGAGLVCDLEMTQTAMQARITGQNYNGAYRLWNKCANYFPATPAA